MIRELVQSGFRLSGTRDARLMRGLVWCVAEGFFSALFYVALYGLLHNVFTGVNSPAQSVGYSLAMLASVALRIGAGYCGMPLIFSGAYAMMGEARLRIADHLGQLPMGWFNRQRGGDLAARLTSDLELIEHLWSHFLGVFVSGLAMPIFLMLFLLWVNWHLALLTCAGIPLALLMLSLSQRMAARPGERMIASGVAAQSALLEYVQGIAVIRSFGRFGQAWLRLESILTEHHDATLAVESKPAPWLAGYGFMLEMGYISLVLAGVWWLSDGTLSPGALILFLILALPVYRQLFDVGLSTLMLRFARRSLMRIESLLKEKAMPEPVSPLPPKGEDIVFEHVSFAYDDLSGTPQTPLTLNDISCTIPANAFTAIVGPSGAGKSTLIQLIARLWDVRHGQIRLGGIDLRDIGTEQLHQHVAMVFQDVVLFAGSVLDNLRIGKPNASREEAIVAAKRAQAHRFIEALPQGYDTLLEEGGGSLSGGERQRISIARALLKNAPILLLDEATASVDPSAEAEIQRAMTELAHGRTIIVIAHRLKNIRHADLILVLKNGRLVEQGKHQDLLAQDGLYALLWQHQQQAQGWKLSTSA